MASARGLLGRACGQGPLQDCSRDRPGGGGRPHQTRGPALLATGQEPLPLAAGYGKCGPRRDRMSGLCRRQSGGGRSHSGDEPRGGLAGSAGDRKALSHLPPRTSRSAAHPQIQGRSGGPHCRAALPPHHAIHPAAQAAAAEDAAHLSRPCSEGILRPLADAALRGHRARPGKLHRPPAGGQRAAAQRASGGVQDWPRRPVQGDAAGSGDGRRRSGKRASSGGAMGSAPASSCWPSVGRFVPIKNLDLLLRSFAGAGEPETAAGDSPGPGRRWRVARLAGGNRPPAWASRTR